LNSGTIKRIAASQTTADVQARIRKGPGPFVRGKSELRRAVRRVTPGQGDLKDSGTENIPPFDSPSRGKGEKVR